VAGIVSGNIVFRLSGEDSYIHDRPAVREAVFVEVKKNACIDYV
jgi:hypothetical protein